jgi:hypothetical protein
VVDVDEGRQADKIIQVEANDGDCSAKFGDICRYDLLNKDQPFTIDNEGTVSQSYFFSVCLDNKHKLSNLGEQSLSLLFL